VFFVFLLVLSSIVHGNNHSPMLKDKIKHLFSDEEDISISQSPIKGLIQVIVGNQVIYFSEDGAKAIKGEIIDIETERNLTDEVKNRIRSETLKNINETELVSFKAKRKKKLEKIFVFTDVDCGYCQKFHQEIPNLNAKGVDVHYLAFPRGGMESEGAKKLKAVWCSKDRAKSMTRAKQNKIVEFKECDNPVEKHFNIGLSMGIFGTPAVYSESGNELGGYMTAGQVVKKLMD